ncbi:MAG TPA: hypothetical protein VJV74_12455, partial [Terriglobia bacterium]|nr:hypothetical protein [Terriglobia bacterium]
FDSANGDLVANYKLGPGVEDPPAAPAIFVFGPDGFRKPMEVKKIAAGTFRGRLNIGAREGLFRARPVEESRAFPEIGMYRPEAELEDYGSDAGLLRHVAQFTGGRFEPNPSALFEPGRRNIQTTLQLWPGLLGLAVLLGLVELVMRKWKGMIGKA